MNLQKSQIPTAISPWRLCTPSRIAGERKMASAIREVAECSDISRILDVGCGAGEYRFLFPGAVYTGIDVVNSNFAAKTSDQHFFLVCDAVHLPFKANSHDVIFSSYAFEYFDDPGNVLKEMHRVLKHGGKVVLCLPTKHVRVYDVVSDWLRARGISIGQVSAQPGIRYHNPLEMKGLAQASNLVTSRTVSVYGWPLLLLKLLISWYRVFSHLFTRFIKKLSGGRLIAQAKPLYIDREVGSARNYREWKEILERNRKLSLLAHTYLRLVKVLSRLDDLAGSVPAVEYITILVKPKEGQKT